MFSNWRTHLEQAVALGILFAVGSKVGTGYILQNALAVFGALLITGIWIWRTLQFRTEVFRKFVPTFIPPPTAMMIAPPRKTVLKISRPAKVKIGETITISAEMYSYVVPMFSYLDSVDAVFKRIPLPSEHLPLSITLETPSFEYAPQGPVVKNESERFPLIWKWILEPKALGKKLVQLNLNEEVQHRVGADSPVEISIEVVSHMGLSARTTYWLQRIGIILGVLLTLPFLAPFFKKIGGDLVDKLFHTPFID